MRIVEYIKEVRGEMTHVSWPTRKQTVIFTLLVIGVSVAVSVYLGAFDYVLKVGLKSFFGF